MSGQLINYRKSILTFSCNASAIQKQVVAAVLNISHSDSLGKHLGCLVFQGRPSNTTFQEIISKATTKLEGWKAKCFSKVGRTILIQSHLESVLAHTMQCFEIPHHTSKYLEKCSREFIWRKSNTEKGLPMIS